MDNYPPGAAHDPNAPYNEVEVPEREFDVTISISLSRTVQCYTNKYIPEVDEENGHLYVDTSDTPWSEVFGDNHKTIPELLEELRKYIQKDLDNIDKVAEEQKCNKAFLKRKLEFLLEECDDWNVDEEDYEGELY
jgi:hypothetical protein